MKLSGLLKTLAPTITKTIASSNPVAGLAVKMLADKLGIDEKNPVKIEKFLEKNPEKKEMMEACEKADSDKIDSSTPDCEREWWNMIYSRDPDRRQARSSSSSCGRSSSSGESVQQQAVLGGIWLSSRCMHRWVSRRRTSRR